MPGTDSERSRMTGAGPARPLDFVFVLRPALLAPLWIFFAQGARLAAKRGWWFDTVFVPGAVEWLGLLSITGILAGAYLLNQIVDVETDRLNNKLFFLPRGIIGIRAAWFELGLVWLVALGVAVWLGGPHIRVSAAALAISVTYSASPVRAKSRAILDIVWNAAGFGLVGALAGFATRPASSSSPLPVLSLLSYAAAVGGVTASTIVLDRDGDRQAGLRTTAVALGGRVTSLVGLLLLTVAVLLGLAAMDPVAVGGSVVSLALALRAHRRMDRASRVSANQLGVAAFALGASVFSPYLLVLLVGVVAASRAYYRRRFGFSYPGPESN
jgi:4-hydroxybenzoate polyprenyltransferase